jgi:hypothetical protein
VLGFILYVGIGFAAMLVLLALGPLAIVLALGGAFIYFVARVRP